MNKMKKTIVLSLLIILPLVLYGCYLYEIIQPSTVEAGGVFTTNITITDMNSEHNNPHKGVIAILVPDDWSFIDGTYDTPMGTGIMVLDTSTHPAWGDVDTVIERPEGMKWINLLSDTGYFHDANMVYESTINLRVGQKSGEFPIGYLTTVNTTDMLIFMNDQENDQELAGVDTSMDHMVTITPVSGIRETKLGGIPSEYKLSQNYPNPFNPSTSINYSVVSGTNVNLAVYDASGKEVEVLVNGFKSAGNYSVSFSRSDLSSGIYYYRIFMNGYTETHKMILMK